jgi:DNA-binding protein H-NS
MISFDNNDHDDYIKLIMTDYNCERCEEKDKVIQNNEQRINDYIAYIKKQSMQKSHKESLLFNSHTQTEADFSNVNNTSSNGNNSMDKSSSNLRSCHKILLSNYIRQFRVYLDNLDEEESEKTTQMQTKLSSVADK